jgi:ABC-type uncharacterized transport system permease subunit
MSHISHKSRLLALSLLLIGGALALMAQTYSSSSNSSFNLLYCICPGIVLLIGIGARIYTSQAGTYTDEVVTSLPPYQVMTYVEQHFPQRSTMGRGWNRKQVPMDPSTVEMATFLFPTWGGCVLMLMSGIIWGLIVYYLVMGRTEKVMLRILEQQGSTRISISGRGSYGTDHARAFVTNLRMMQPHSAMAQQPGFAPPQ